MKEPPFRHLSSLGLFASISLIISSTLAEEKERPYLWHDVAEFGVEGQGWPAEALASRFDRLPAKAETVVREPVWNLSRHSSGQLFRFTTDASEIKFEYRVTNDKLDMPHMPATGVSGLDIYGLDTDGKWKWVSVARPTAKHTIHTVEGLLPGRRSYQVYLPLFNGLEMVRVGVPEGAEFLPIAPRKEKPIVFYGTSITHGACASRPGMTHPAILGRRFDYPIVNLGFSGNGRMEPEVGALLAEIDAAVYVIDCLPNMNGEQVAERTEPLVRQLR
ncbi:MAG: SGNH/GDSL hydrolase family protein, partial [Verrucomicrobiota bacterium]